MSELAYDLGNGANWANVFDDTRNALEPAPGRYAPIDRLVLPTVLEAQVIAVGTSSSTSPAHWRYAGTLIQRHQISAVGSGLVLGKETKCLLNSFALVQMPLITPTYQLVYDVPPWIRSISLAVWAYHGPVADHIEELIQALRAKAEVIEFKLDRQASNNPTFANQLTNGLDDIP
jgi:hypothetical protein